MKTVIITTDFSETAANAARYGLALSRQMRVKTVILYHSFYPKGTTTEVPISRADHQHAYENSMHALQLLKEEIGGYSGMATVSIADDSPLVVGVGKLYEKYPDSIVVAGATGKSGLAKAFLGNNTSDLAQSGNFPLLVIPRGALFETMKSIVVACNLLQVMGEIHAAKIHTFVHTFNTRILVLNVEKKGKRFNPDMIPGQYKLHDMLDDLEPEYFYIDDEAGIVPGIMKFADEKDADLIITIPKTYGFFERLFHPSISNKLAHFTTIPLLLLK